MKFLACTTLGLAFGSFANVYFYRLPRNLSLITPNSFCPHCSHPILWQDNIPILSFLLLKGKCRFCRSGIAWQYPLVETLCAALFLFISLKFRNETPAALAIFLIFSFLIFLAAGIDLLTYFQSGKEYGIIPDDLMVLLAFLGIVFSFLNPLLNEATHTGGEALSSFRNFSFPFSAPFAPLNEAVAGWRGKLFASLIGGIGGGTFMIVFRWVGEKIFKKEPMGLGDVKMVAATGVWVGWQGTITTLIIGSLVGSIISISLILTKKLDRHSTVPFAPFLAIGSLIVLFLL